MSYLTQRRRALLAAMGDNKALPYDAEIEYLGSTGTQYIDTGIVPNADTGIDARIKSNITGDYYAIGLRDNTSNTRWCLGLETHIRWAYVGYGDAITLLTNIPNSIYYADIQMNLLDSGVAVATCNNATRQVSLPTLSFNPVNNIRLFGTAGVSADYTKWYGNIYYVKISQGNKIIMDLIPVRVGSVGYMYDKISGRLLGNDGTGDFVLGNDITN